MGQRIILGVSGASGVVLARYTAAALKECGAEVHMVISAAAQLTWEIETGQSADALTRYADALYDVRDMGAAIASGSFRTAGMLIVPCSMKTVAGIVSGYTDTLLLRAADVCLKEGRKVALCPRETPLSKVHLRNLCAASDLGCAVIPPMLTFYGGQTTAEEQIHHIVGKLLMQFDMDYPHFRAWGGTRT